MEILMVGFGRGCLEALAGCVPDGSVTVLEEPEVIKRRGLDDVSIRSLRRVVPCRYQSADQYMSMLDQQHREVTVVIPALDYGVLPSARIAETLGLSGAGIQAATALRDKQVLREAIARAGLPTPRWRVIDSYSELQDFALGEDGVVVKPVGRQASVGVTRVPNGRSLKDAWARASIPPGESQWVGGDVPVLAEEMLYGREYSLELGVRDGQVLFANATEKETSTGPSPVELGHTVPARLADTELDMLIEAGNDLLDAIDFGTGIVHAEYMLTDDGPILIECAGRPPGGMIITLIELVYGFNLYRLAFDLLRGAPISRYQVKPMGAASVRHFSASPGIVRSIDGLVEARSVPGIRSVEVRVERGDRVEPLENSWSRAGYAISQAESSMSARSLARRAAAAIHIRTS